MTYATRRDAIEMIEHLLMMDWQSAYVAPGRLEVTLLDMTVDEVLARIQPFLDERGIDEGVQVVPDTVDDMFGSIDCAALRVEMREMLQ